MGNENPVPFEEDDLDSLNDFEDEITVDESSGGFVDEDLPVDNFLGSVAKVVPYRKEHADARREIERRNELKALNSALDEWGDLDDEDD